MSDDWFYAGPFSPLSKGAHVVTPDGREWTVCYKWLDGIGVVEGFHDLAETPNEDLPHPEAMLREPYRAAELPCVGELVQFAPLTEGQS